MRLITLVVAVLATLTPSYAQTIPVDISPLAGRILPPTTPGTITVLAETVEEKKTTYLLLPLLLDTDGLTLGLLNGAAIFPTARPIRVDLSYTYIRPEGGDSLNSYGATLRNTIWSSDGGDAVTLLGAYSDTPDASTKTQVGGVGEYKIRGTPFSASADLRWVRSGGGGGVDDIVPKIAGAFDRGNYTVSADYTFKNDVDGADDYSAEVDIKTAAGVLILGAGKNSTIFVGFLRIF